MTPVRPSDGGNLVGVTRGRQPIVDGGANASTLDRRLAGPVVTRDQENYAIDPDDRLVETAIDRRPGGIKVHPVKVDDPIRNDRAAAQLLVPTAVERLFTDRNRLGHSRRL